MYVYPHKLRIELKEESVMLIIMNFRVLYNIIVYTNRVFETAV